MRNQLAEISIGGVSLPAADAPVVLAISVLIERITKLADDDKHDLFELMKNIPTIQTKEDRDSFIKAFMEILEQDGSTVAQLEMVENEMQPEKLKKWVAWISKEIRNQREASNMTQADLAAKSGLPQSHISRLENGQHSPSHATLKKIANALGIEVDTLSHTW